MPSTIWAMGLRQTSLRMLAFAIVGSLTVADEKPDVAAIASQLLDDKLSQEERKQIVESHPDIALDLLKALTDGLKPGNEEYRRIPWIWRVAIEAAKRNEGTQVRDILVSSLPKARRAAARLAGGRHRRRDHQRAQPEDIWPREQLTELLAGDAGLQSRWDRLLVQAGEMADNETVVHRHALRRAADSRLRRMGAARRAPAAVPGRRHERRAADGGRQRAGRHRFAVLDEGPQRRVPASEGDEPPAGDCRPAARRRTLPTHCCFRSTRTASATWNWSRSRSELREHADPKVRELLRRSCCPTRNERFS